MPAQDRISRLNAALEGRYRIERQLGEGGMATVFLAKDLKHDRQVAVKVMKPEAAAAMGTERFLAEIRTTANLSHPHILPLHDSGESSGFLFYVMPFVEGESLRERMDEERELEVEEAVRITRQVASALQHAHSKGVVHRDIKPENILLQAEQVVVADFGIAVAIDSAGGTRLTETGLTLGTPAYMSPEQAAAERSVDARSDIYSLACVLFEMLAGDPPFTAKSARALVAKHLVDPAPPVTTVRPGVPRALATAVSTALSKTPSDRYRSAEAFAEALLVEPAHLEAQGKSIAVLPFENLSADPDQEYFCDGMTEEIINALSHVEDLKVIARTSAFAFKGRHQDVREIGRALDVEHLLEGSVRKAASRLRITAQLVRADDGSHVWSDRYDRDMDDVFEVQDEIALAIVDTLKARLLSGEKEAVTKRYTDDLELYNLYLLGRHHWQRFTPEGFQFAERYLEEAIARDPAFPLAHVGIAEMIHVRPFFDDCPPKTVIPRAKTHIEKALEIDPNLAEAHAILGRIRTFYDWDWEAAEEEYEHALTLNPNSANAHNFYAHLLNLTGRHDRAVEEASRARDLDPLNVFINAIWGERAYHAGRLHEALVDLEQTVAMDQGHYYTRLIQGWVYGSLGKWDEAISALESSLTLSDREPMAVSSLANAYWVTGKTDEADKLLNELQGKAEHRFIPPFFFFAMHKTRGDLDKALEWFERAVHERDFMLVFCTTWPGEEWRIPDDRRFHDALGRLR